MGGFGSGRYGGRTKAEDCRSIEINRLNRKGCLKPGYRGTWAWWRDSERVAAIGLSSDGFTLTLNYRHQDGFNSEWVEVTEAIPIERVPCRYGGTRPFFRCPGVINGKHCSRRVGKLFSPARYFLCRHCYRIAYTSQSETTLDRLYRKANKSRVALGGMPGMASPLPEKPKGMWHRTYYRHIEEIFRADECANAEFNRTAGLWLDRMNPTWRQRE